MTKVLIILLAVIAVLGTGGWTYLQHPKFGPSNAAMPSARILASPNYADGEFRNLVDTPLFTEEISFLAMVFRNLTEEKPDGLRPTSPLPSVKADLKALDKSEDVIVWLGHSSFYVQLGGRRILIEPVFSTFAAPAPLTNKAFDGTTPYSAADMPEIDYLLITHEHWDHLDYDTVTALRPKTRHVVVALGVGAYLELWDYPKDRILELDWNERVELDPGLTIHALPARHYTRRLLSSNQTLWVSFALVSDRRRLFFSGDSGYGPHFAEIGERFGGFDMAALDSGQYSPSWVYIHMTPEEAAQAAEDLQARTMMPIHVGKFAISKHTWNEPFIRLVEASHDRAYRLMTPLIGKPVDLNDQQQELSRWWEGLE
ncbi:MAG: MBL fold metallo-hydrolase [Gammaproteobacteria bacterium]|nr:MBL fold metallo-hydrolase [Gammaproteobacteria bacterium]